MTGHKSLLDVMVKNYGAGLPSGADSWAVKSVHPDLRTRHGFRWPWPGQWAECNPNRIDPDNTNACPNRVGDGVCIATTWGAMASSRIPAHTLLLVAYNSAGVLGGGGGKLRVFRAYVADVVDGTRLVKTEGQGANLLGANLQYANLKYANLRDANLLGANLLGANLQYANLQYANLREANLRWANLREANLQYADLREADLREADLQGADLLGAKGVVK